LRELAITAVGLVNMDYAGVDIIQDSTGRYVVIEINSVPAWKGLQSVCAVDLASCLVNDLIDRYGLGCD